MKVLVTVLVGVSLAACSGGDSKIELDAGAADGDVDSDTDADADTDTGCSIECPDDMVYVPDHCACIDSHEFTNEEFIAFLNVNGTNGCFGFLCRVLGVESKHATNVFEVIHEGEYIKAIVGNDIEEDGGVFSLAESVGDFPVGWVTFSGAKAACLSEQKSLCSEEIWYAACSHNSQWHFPYGGETGGPDDYDGYMKDYRYGACLTGGSSYDAKVGSFPECEGGYPGLFDMTGNLAEWVGSGNVLRGGHMGTNDAEDGESDNGAGCKFNGVYELNGPPDNFSAEWVGFRCCLVR